MRPAGIATALLVLSSARSIAQQCADGSPPPCATPVRQVASAVRKADPPLDDRTWIVVPFNNVTRAPDVDYLRDASVNLLYLDLSKWSDIRVIDDARVADLIRQVPEAKVTPLSLDAATAVAKRAGAGRLVMGNVIKQGAKTTLATKVFDVRRGAVIRSPQQDLLAPDSLMSAFGKLAGSVLGVAPPPGIEIASVGTSRVDAYQEYLTGLVALKKFDLAGARPHFEQALKLDSNFALAHYNLSILLGWDNANDPGIARHAEAAARLAVTSGLPARERTLMKAHNEFEKRDWGTACATYGSLIKADSTDVDALYGLGECSFHDLDVLPYPLDTTKRIWRGNRNTAIRAFERVLELDPTFHLAFQHILDALSNESRSIVFSCAQPPCTYYAMTMASGDSLLMVATRDTAEIRRNRIAYAESNSRRRNLLRAREKAQAWVDAAPDESRAHLELGNIETLLGNWDNAAAELAKVHGPLSGTETGKFLSDRIELMVRSGKTADVRRLADSAMAVAPPTNTAVVWVSALLGRMRGLDSLVRAQALRQGPQAMRLLDYQYNGIRIILTRGTPTLDSIETRFLDSLAALPVNPSSPLGIPTILYAPWMAKHMKPVDYPANDPRAAAIVAITHGDTARLRMETRAADSALRARPAGAADSAAGIQIAELYLMVGDSAAALRVMRRMMDTTMSGTSIMDSPAVGFGPPILTLWPRMALMRADLEAAVGDRRAARNWYRQFIDLWSTADKDFQPLVDGARKSLAALKP